MTLRSPTNYSRIRYDPKAHGANCNVCPLKGSIPVGPENRASKLVLLGESPGNPEVYEGRPFVGACGKLVEGVLRALNLNRGRLHITNTICCRPKSFMRTKEWDAAIACCKPRLDAELGQNRSIIAAGAYALRATTSHSKIMQWFGSPLESEYGTVFPIFHPSFVLRKPAYRPVFKQVFAHAIGLAYEKIKPWKWPKLVINPPYASFLNQLLEATEISVDIENVPKANHIRCIGVSTRKLAVSVPLSPEGMATSEDFEALRKVLSGPALKIFHNMQHDRLELEQHGWEINGPFYDTMLAHAINAPRLDHNLSFVCAIETIAPRWKTEKNVEEDKESYSGSEWFAKSSLDDLLPYNAKDNVMQATIKPILDRRLSKVHNGQKLYSQLMNLTEIAMRMRQHGIFISKENLEQHRENLTKVLSSLRDKFRQILPDEKYVLGANGQHPSLAKLFFEEFRAVPIAYSQTTGKPSLDSNTLTSYIASFTSVGQSMKAELARLILSYRKHAKLFSSYVEKLPVHTDGAIHPIWRAFGARTGRWSATEPAIQTIPKPKKKKSGEEIPGLRNLFCPRPGKYIVEADWSALEARIAAFVSHDDPFLQWFADGTDVHWKHARSAFGPDATKQHRDLAKQILYGGFLYGGSAETIWKKLVVEVPDLPLRSIIDAVEGIKTAHPQFVEWQQQTILDTNDLKYVEESLSGRRQYYHDGNVKPTEPPNFKIQGAAGFLANRAIETVAKQIDWKNDAILMQVHDSIVLEGLDPVKLGRILRNAMEEPVELNGVTVSFPVDIKYSETNWGEMKELKV